MKKYSLEELNTLAQDTINLMKVEFTFPDSSFFLEKEGNRIFNTNIFADVGDYLPFFMYFGEEEYIKKHIELIKEKMKNDVLISDLPTFGVNHLAKTYDYTDFLLGIIDYYDFVKDDKTKDWVIRCIDKSIKIFNLNNNPSSFFYTPLNIRIPLLDTRDGTLIETFLDAFAHFGKEEYLFVAKNIYLNLINTDHFKKYGIFADFDSLRFIKKIFNKCNVKKFESVTICKNNTNTLFGFLSLYKITKEKSILENIDSILLTIKYHGTVEGFGIGKKWSLNKKPSNSFLTASFSMIEFLSDAYVETNNVKYLDFAEGISMFWIKKQGQTGLFPVFSDGKETFIDSETDMCVALYKMYEITNNIIYKDSADKCFDGIINFHVKQDFVLGVHIDNGSILNNIQRTKFIGLFLKLIILKIHYIKGDLIYKNIQLYSLLRDR